MKKYVGEKVESKRKIKNLRLFLTIVIFLLIFVGVFLIVKYTGVWDEINSINKLRKIVERGGVFSFIIFIILQILQTTVFQIPAMFVTIAGTFIFGPWQTFCLSFIAIMIGSIIMFWVGRRAGRKFLCWLAGEERAELWIDRLSTGKYLYFLMMLFPLFPDDILCVVAGMMDMSFGFFFWTNVIARSLGLGCTVFFGSGAIIPFYGWGLIVWGLFILGIATLFYVSVKYRNRIDEICKQFFRKKQK